jgi:hypothetical protein
VVCQITSENILEIFLLNFENFRSDDLTVQIKLFFLFFFYIMLRNNSFFEEGATARE